MTIREYIANYVAEHNDELTVTFYDDEITMSTPDDVILYQVDIESTSVDSASLSFCVDNRDNIRMLEYDEDTDYDDEGKTFQTVCETLLDNLAKIYNATSVKRKFIELLNDDLNPMINDPRLDS